MMVKTKVNADPKISMGLSMFVKIGYPKIWWFINVYHDFPNDKGHYLIHFGVYGRYTPCSDTSIKAPV